MDNKYGSPLEKDGAIGKTTLVHKINNEMFIVGHYSIIKDDGCWVLSNNKREIIEANYFDRDIAIKTAIMMYASGYLVAEGTRDLLKIVASEMK
jgi:hypothetical protein